MAGSLLAPALLVPLALVLWPVAAQEQAPPRGALGEVLDGLTVARAPLLEGALEAFLEDAGVPGVVAARGAFGGSIDVAAAGLLASGEGAPMAANSLVHVGSCTKAMTAVLAARLVDRGELAWDSTLAEVLPELAEGADPAWGELTLLDCLTHTSGLPANASSWWAHGDRPVVERRLAIARDHLRKPPRAAPGTAYLYSNLGYVVAGSFCEAAGGAPWEELVRREVFAPLGMDSAGFGPPGSEDELDQPRGHRLEGGEVGEPRYLDNAEALGPAGRVHLTVADWCRFALALSDGAARWDAAGTPFLSAESREVLRTPHLNRYACGWIVAPPRPGRPLRLSHAGSNTFWFAEVDLEPEEGVVRVVVVNAAGDGVPRAVRGLLARLRTLYQEPGDGEGR